MLLMNAGLAQEGSDATDGPAEVPPTEQFLRHVAKVKSLSTGAYVFATVAESEGGSGGGGGGSGPPRGAYARLQFFHRRLCHLTRSAEFQTAIIVPPTTISRAQKYRTCPSFSKAISEAMSCHHYNQ